MAILHKVFSFNQSLVDNILMKCNEEDFKSFEEDLYNQAVSSINRFTKNQNEILIMLRYDDQWLQWDHETYQLDRWFLLSLIQDFSPAPNLSNTEPFSYWILSKILPIIGWDYKKIARIEFGDDLNSLITLGSNHPFAQKIRFTQYYGGWLNQNDIEELYREIKLQERKFLYKNEIMINLIDGIGYQHLSKPEVIRKSYFDLLKMLEWPMGEKQSLFIIQD